MPNVEHSPDANTGKVTTRSRSQAAKVIEEDLETLKKRSQEVQAQLMSDQEKFKMERDRFEHERNETLRALREREASIKDREHNACSLDNTATPSNDIVERLLREVAELRNQIGRASTPAINAASTGAIPRDTHYSEYRDTMDRSSRERRPTMDDQEELTAPRLSFREVLDTIPTFNGYNMPVTQFARACRRARDLFPAHAERNLTRMICNKLRDRAAAAVEDEPCSSITQLIDLLNGAFGVLKNVDQYRGELSMIFLRPNEHILDYISRVKDLRAAIIDSMRREYTDTQNRLDEVDTFTVRSFCDGLPLTYRLQMQIDRLANPAEAFSAAKGIARRQELDSQRYDRNPRPPPLRAYERPPVREQPPPPRASAIAYNRDRPGYRPDSARRSPEVHRDWPRAHAPPRDGRNYGRPPNALSPAQPRRDIKWCSFCKISGHDYNECRKRQYYNRNNNTNNNDNNVNRSGNGSSPSRNTGEPREAYRRPQHQVNVIKEEKTEQTKTEPSTSQC